MSLSAAQLHKIDQADRSHDRMQKLRRMNSAELHRLFGGDPMEAAIWVQTAAEHGSPSAQLRWGAMLLDGQGVPGDRAMALHWFTIAARRGSGEAMNMVGRCHENGWGVTPDAGKAADWYRRSADTGNDWGCYNYANMLFDGTGLPCDRSKALRFYRRAADQGHGRAMNLLGRCFEDGWGCQKDRAQAAIWYQRSAAAGYFRGQFNHASLLLEDGQPVDAGHWFKEAVLSGDEAIRLEIKRRLIGVDHPALVAIFRSIA